MRKHWPRRSDYALKLFKLVRQKYFWLSDISDVFGSKVHTTSLQKVLVQPKHHFYDIKDEACENRMSHGPTSREKTTTSAVQPQPSPVGCESLPSTSGYTTRGSPPRLKLPPRSDDIQGPPVKTISPTEQRQTPHSTQDVPDRTAAPLQIASQSSQYSSSQGAEASNHNHQHLIANNTLRTPSTPYLAQGESSSASMLPQKRPHSQVSQSQPESHQRSGATKSRAFRQPQSQPILPRGGLGQALHEDKAKRDELRRLKALKARQ